MKRLCIVCCTPFATRSSGHKTCGDKCASVNKKNRMARYNKAYRSNISVAYVKANLKRFQENVNDADIQEQINIIKKKRSKSGFIKTCAICSEEFIDLTNRSVYCSKKCHLKSRCHPLEIRHTSCKICGQQFSYEVRGMAKVTCSYQCYEKLYRLQQKEHYLREKAKGVYRSMEYYAARKEWAKNNPDKVSVMKKKSHKKQVDKIADWYVRTCIKSHGIFFGPISPELVKAKRKGIKLHRKIKQIKQCYL